MTNIHPKFPFGKGLWIWNIPACEGGDISKIIDKCKKFGINYLIIKSADGENCYPNNTAPQLTKAIVDQFHASNIGIYSWGFNYGYNPTREAALILWSLEQLGVDGHVLDAESEFEKLPDPATAATTIFSIVRAKHPEAFLAHAPYPYIDYHTRFPYVIFGENCDAVMPQMYWGTIGISVGQMINDMFAQFLKWEKTWTASGHGGAVKPIIPLGQVYDNPETKFVQTPDQIKEFITSLAGYGSVNFWDWQHMVRLDLWAAIRDTAVKAKEAFNLAQTESPTAPHEESSTTPPVVPTPPIAQPQPTQPSAPVSPAQNPPTNGVSENSSTVVPPVVPVPPTEATTTPIASVPMPTNATGPTTITVTPDKNEPGGVSVEVSKHKPHIDYIIELIKAIIDFLTHKSK